MGFNSPSHNPENEQVQYLQKIAIAENPSGLQTIMIYLKPLDPKDFLHEVQFFAAIGAAYFPAAETGLLSPLSPAIFTRNRNIHFVR